MTPHRAAIGLAAAALLTLTGCGGGKDDDPGRSATVAASAEIVVVGDEYSFDPETLVVTGASGGPLEMTLRNAGALAHNLRVIRDGSEVGGSPTFQGGEERTFELQLEPGTYEMVCTVGNHEQLGMTGTLELR